MQEAPHPPANLVSKFKKDPHKLVAAQAEITEKAKAQIKDRQAELLAETSTAVDWGAIGELLQQEIKAKGVRSLGSGMERLGGHILISKSVWAIFVWVSITGTLKSLI